MVSHEGHRARLRQRFLEQGIDGFHEVHILELLLFYAVPRQDTNELAHRLLNHFGSLAGVLEATPQILMQAGLTENAAALIVLTRELIRVRPRKPEDEQIVHSTVDAGEILLPLFYGRRDEIVYLLCMDGKGKVLNCVPMFEGAPNATSISVRKIAEAAMACNAVAVILAHNHPSGLALPSAEDESSTRRLWEALQKLDINLLDHLIVADGDFVSMADNGLFRQLH